MLDNSHTLFFQMFSKRKLRHQKCLVHGPLVYKCILVKIKSKLIQTGHSGFETEESEPQEVLCLQKASWYAGRALLC